MIKLSRPRSTNLILVNLHSSTSSSGTQGGFTIPLRVMSGGVLPCTSATNLWLHINYHPKVSTDLNAGALHQPQVLG